MQRGFLDPTDWARAGRRDAVRVSDLIQVVMAVPGVAAAGSAGAGAAALTAPSEVPVLAATMPPDVGYRSVGRFKSGARNLHKLLFTARGLELVR